MTLRHITDLIRAGEWGIALETLCTQIHEYDLELEVSLGEELIRLGRGLQTPVAHLLGDPWADPANLSEICGRSMRPMTATPASMPTSSTARRRAIRPG